ncbi:acyltransferase family protein [Vulcanococcus limneticus]|uniref:acyltransferase family protein n=1 Tax=Vulcanococcus limneticus TaxID=2170428 RepID=UPI00398C0640
MEPGSTKRGVYGYIPEIDGLRAAAVLAVFINHLHSHWLPGGFVGVDVFFVISGYVVSKSLMTAEYHSPARYLGAFYARRVLRILPALLACLLVTTFFTILFIPQSWLSESIPITGQWAIFGAANIALINTTDGYFAPRAEFNPFTHTWSLGVEEQFYLLFPIIFLLWMRHRGSKDIWIRRCTTLLLPALLIASLVTAVWLCRTAPDRGFYSLLSRFWELAAGALLYQWHVGRPQHRVTPPQTSSWLHQALPLLGVVLIGVSFVACQPDKIPMPMGLLPVAGTLALIHVTGGGSRPVRWLSQILAHPTARQLGLISYSLYLWHWPVIVLMRWTVGLRSAVTLATAVGLSLGLALASYYWLESPIRTSAFLRRAPNLSKIGMGMAAAWASLLGTTSAFAHQASLTLSVTRDRQVWAPSAAWSPPPPRTAQPGSSEVPRQILKGRRIFVAGNSHAGAYEGMLSRVRHSTGLDYSVSMDIKCPVGRVRVPLRNLEGCTAAQDTFLAHLKKEARPGDLVFFASLRVPRFRDQWTKLESEASLLKDVTSPSAAEYRRQGRLETEELIDRIKAMGLHVLIDLPKPWFKTPPFRCSDWFNRSHPICAAGFQTDPKVLQKLRAPIVAEILAMRVRHPDLVIWDPFPRLCPSSPCQAFADGKPLFFDGDHLSGFGNETLYTDFLGVLANVWPESLRHSTP